MKKRIDSIDLLKCLSMLMVVVLHLNGYGLQNVEYNPYGIIGFARTILQSFSIVGVNLFVLITGYFLCSKQIDFDRRSLLSYYKRLLPLWIQVEFYSIGIYLLLCAIPHTNVHFSLRELLNQIFPILTNRYWFVTIYFLLIVVSPFINALLQSLTQEKLKSVLCVLFIVFSVIPTINIFGDPFGTAQGYSLLWFIVLYITGAYIKFFEFRIKHNTGLYFLFTLIIFSATIFVRFAPKGISGLMNLIGGSYNSIAVYGASVALFLIFLDMKHAFTKTGLIIRWVSSLTFAVYLIHEHSVFRDVLWRQIICLERFSENEWLCLLMMIAAVIAIYFGSIMIEFIRNRLFLMVQLIGKKVIKYNHKSY